MSGHSKWNNIKHKKEKADAAKAKIFTKIGKEMAVAMPKALDKKSYKSIKDKAERKAAKKAKDFALADAIRNELLEHGIIIKDTREGVKWEKA